jgi:hypothetical protein
LEVSFSASLPEFHHPRLDQVDGLAAKGAGLARFERDFRENAKEPLTLDDLLALLGNAEGSGEHSREDAIACALSASEGWQDAVRRLRGAFAEHESGLNERKDELPGD